MDFGDDHRTLALGVILAGAVIENGGVLIVKESSWNSELIEGKKVSIEVTDDYDLVITLEEQNGN